MNPRPTLPGLALASALLALALPASLLVAVPVPPATHPGAGQTVYFVLTDRFANGDPTNDTGGWPGGADDHGFDPTRISHYHGGDLRGLIDRLDYLRDLGMTAVWFTPPLQNKPVQDGTAGYHGYWITDFERIDPHLGTNTEFEELILEAHARGMKIYMDIITNHTADVIQYADGDYAYVPLAAAAYRDAAGHPFDPRAVAYNGLGDPAAFPALDAATSFPKKVFVPPAEANLKNPAWLNDTTLYHNRGNTTFANEDSVYGDFAGLDDTFTEHPRVVRGFIEIFTRWLDTGIDGYRIDTARHVNAAFWRAFNPAIAAAARARGRPDFLQFGEVYHDSPRAPQVLSEFSTGMPMDSTLDFGFFTAARTFVSREGDAGDLGAFFHRDDLYTDHDSNIHAAPTFLGNHDAGRFPHFLQQDNPDATPDSLADLTTFAHSLLYLVRGAPVLYYGDEQGMIGRGGHDMQARESLFPSRAPDFRDAPLLATTRTGADDKFDPAHPFYRHFARLGALRAAHPALRTGAMLVRPAADDAVFAFSRFDRAAYVEYLAVFNRDRHHARAVALPTSQPPGATLERLLAAPDSIRKIDTPHPAIPAALTTAAGGRVALVLPPLGYALYRATAPLPANTAPPAVTLALPDATAERALLFTTEEVDGLLFTSRARLTAEVHGGDGYAEVTFTFERASRPGQVELIGTDEAAPYAVHWRPPADLDPTDTLRFTATVNDRRGHVTSASLDGYTIAPASETTLGVTGSTTPLIAEVAPREITLDPGESTTLTVAATGTGPLVYAWLHNNELVPDADAPTLEVSAPGRYRAVVRGLGGTTLGAPLTVIVAPSAPRRVTHDAMPSAHVAPRQIDVWLPPGYDATADAHYPVIYLHDGQNKFDPATSYGGETWDADAAMLELIARDAARPAILVAIWSTPDRSSEYMPQKAVAHLPTHPAGPVQSDAYLRFLVTELKPFIDATYRTRPDRADTFVLGSSMGGLISAYALAEYPDVFGGAGCVSTHWPIADGAVVDYLAKHLPAPGQHRWWFDYGTGFLDHTYAPYQARMDTLMRRAGYTEGDDWITRRYPGAHHNEIAWRARLASTFAFLLGPTE